MNRLDHVVTNNIKTNKDHIIDAIYDETVFNTNSFNSSIGTRDPLPVVTSNLLVFNQHRVTTVAALTCLWDIRATDSMINRKHTKHYERKMWSNNVEYSTSVDMYCTTHDVKVSLCMLEFSISKIINHRFHVYNDKGKSVIGYDMIIGRDLMVHLGLSADFKCQVLQLYGATVYIK